MNTETLVSATLDHRSRYYGDKQCEFALAVDLTALARPAPIAVLGADREQGPSMSVDIVFSIVARDRPGLVQTVAETVAAHSGNWIDSAMSRLGGEFAGIVRVAVPDEDVAGLEAALVALSEKGMTVTTHRAGESAEAPGRAVRFELTGSDHPGIVRDISAALARFGVSIDELETGIFPGSMSGEKLFAAKARVVLPEGLDADDLRDELESIAQDIMVDIELKEVD